MGIDDAGFDGVFFFTATSPSLMGTRPVVLANRKVTSPSSFYTPRDGSPFVDPDGARPIEPESVDGSPVRTAKDVYDDLTRIRKKWQEKRKALPGRDLTPQKNKWEHAQAVWEITCRYGRLFALIVSEGKEIQDTGSGEQSWDDWIWDLQSNFEGLDGEIPPYAPISIPFGGSAGPGGRQ